MKTLFTPAIALMNRLKFGQKFLLMSLAFMIPVFILATMVIRSQFETLNKAELELNGIVALEMELTIIDQTMALRDYSLASSFRELKELTEQEVKYSNTIINSLTNLQKYLENSRQSAIVINKVIDFKKTLQSQQVKEGGAMDARQQFDFLSKNVNKAIDILNLIARSSGLTSDTDTNIALQVSLITSTLMEGKKSISRGRAFGTFVLTQGQLDDVVNSQINDVIDGIDNFIGVLTDINNQLEQQGVNVISLDEVKTSLADYQVSLEDDILLAVSLDRAWSDFFKSASLSLSSLNTIESQVTPSIKVELEKRFQSQYSILVMIGLALSIALIVLTYLFVGLIMSIKQTLRHFDKAMSSIASGDLKTRVHLINNDELGVVATEFDQMVDGLQLIIKDIREAVEKSSQETHKLSLLASQSQNNALKQRQDSAGVYEAIRDMVKGIDEASKSSADAAKVASNSRGTSQKASDLVQETLTKFETLGSSLVRSQDVVSNLATEGEAIKDATTMIQAVAEQTNLLALNASIEAARAGEQGRGFAVVADEVRALAVRTRESTEQIEKIVNSLRGGVQDVVDVMDSSNKLAKETLGESNQVAKALSEIINENGKIAEKNEIVAHSVSEQSRLAGQIQESLQSIEMLGQATSDAANETKQECSLLSERMVHLDNLTRKFQA
ncbi:MAG: methyl-accepting chemotaxis protein [bacterium]